MVSFGDPVTLNVIKELQQKFKQEYESNPDEYIERDLDRVLNDAYYVYRFYRSRSNNYSATWDMLVSTMKWRKSKVKLDTYKDSNFPIEFYKVAAVFPYEPDKNGYTTVYIRVSQHRKVPELEEYAKAFFVHVFDKVDRLYGAKGYAIIFDLTRASYRNLDWDYLRFMINFGAYYCPAGAKYILVLNVPWALNTFRKMVFSFLNDDYFKLIKFANGDQIYDYIDRENVPHYLGGKCTRNYCSVPKNSVPIERLVENYGYSKADVDRIMPVYQDALDEAEQFLSTVDWYEVDGYFDDDDNNNVDQLKMSDEQLSTAKVIDPRSVFSCKPELIEFKFNPTLQRYSADLIIENLWDQPISYKIQSNAPNDYSVSPRHGIIGSKSIVKVTIDLLKSWTENRYNISSKFRVMVLPEVKSRMTLEEFNNLWCSRSSEILSTIVDSKVIKEFPVGSNRQRRRRSKQNGVSGGSARSVGHLFQNKLPKWSDDLSIEDKLRYLGATATSLESKQRKLSLSFYCLGFAYLLLFSYFLIRWSNQLDLSSSSSSSLRVNKM